jgi:hypothetical protein
MGVANENLRNRAAPSDLHHVGTGFGISVNANFFNVRHPFGRQQLLGTNAVWANGSGVHLDDLHGGFSEMIW